MFWMLIHNMWQLRFHSKANSRDLYVFYAHSSSSYLQLLAVFMQMGARELLMHYMDLKQTNDVQLTFEALKVTSLSCS